MLLIDSGDKATGQATYYTWDVKKHEFIEGEPFLTYEKEKNGGFWNRIFWEGEKTVCWTEMKNTEFYANVKFSDDVEVIDGGQVFGDEEKYEWTVGAYLVSYERNEFRDPFDGIEGKRYALPGEPPHDVLGTKTSHGEPRFIYVEDNQVTVGYYAYEYIEKKLFLDLIVASYPLNDVNKVEWKAISIPEKYEAGAIFVGSSPRNPLCVDGKVYLLGDDYMIACDFKNDQIISQRWLRTVGVCRYGVAD